MCELQVSVTTVARRLKARGIRARIPAVKEFLTADQKAQRLYFAQSFVDKSPEWWRKMIFSDEKSFG